MRYLAAFGLALIMVFAVLWGGSQIAIMVSQGSAESADFLRGRELDLCGYSVDARFNLAGYDLDEWQGDRCEELSGLDRCVLSCLANAGAIEIARECYPVCLRQ